MTASQLKSKISDLLSANELDAALDLLHREVSADSPSSKLVVALKGACAEFKQEIIQDRFSPENLRQTKSNLVNRALDLTDILTENDLSSFLKAGTDKPTEEELVIPVFFSRGSPFNEVQSRFINYFAQKFEKNGLRLETPLWSSENPLLPVREKMKEVYGCLVLALERMQATESFYKKGSSKEEKFREEYFPTPWVQMEAAMAYQEELPLLIFSDNKLRHEGMIEMGVHEFRVFKINPEKPEDLDDGYYSQLFQGWVEKVRRVYRQRINSGNSR